MPQNRTDTHEKYISFSRIVMIIIIVAMSLVALTISDVVLFVFKTASLLFILAPIFVYGVLSSDLHKSRKLDILMAVAAIISAGVYFYMFSQGMLENPLYVCGPVVVSFILSSLAYMAARKKE